MILFNTEPDIAPFVEKNLKTQKKIAVIGYTWVGKNRQHKEGRGVGYFMKNTEILWINPKLKRQVNFFIKELDKEYEVIEKSIYNYTKTNNNIILVGDFNGKIDNDKNGITNGDTSVATNGRRIRSMVRTLNLDI